MKDTLSYGLTYGGVDDLKKFLKGYSDVKYARCLDSRKSIFSVYIYIYIHLIQKEL